jgi:hypothetical protein
MLDQRLMGTTGRLVAACGAHRKASMRVVLILTFIVSIFGTSLSTQASAQSLTTYTYTGANFNIPVCASSIQNTPTVTCVSGNVTGTLIFKDLPQGYTGTVPLSGTPTGAYLIQVISMTLSAYGMTLSINIAPDLSFDQLHNPTSQVIFLRHILLAMLIRGLRGPTLRFLALKVHRFSRL